MTPSVSIVINTLNRIKYLPLALEAISRLRYEKFEIIVVDGPSTDGTEEYLHKEWGQKIKIRKCPVANLSISRNIGISAASGEIIAFTDDDGIPEPDWLNELVKPYSDQSVAAVNKPYDNVGLIKEVRVVFVESFNDIQMRFSEG